MRPSAHRPALPVLAALLAASALAVGACAHAPRRGDLDSLKPVVEAFHQGVRWGDFSAAARTVAPERREAFLKARRDLREEKDLSILDYALEDVQLAPDGQRAVVTSRMQWLRLPSMSATEQRVTSHFAWREHAWVLERQEGGPFPELR